MSDDNKGATLSLKVMINKERNKVLFAEADSHFTDILLSFLTLPLGRIIKVLKKQYGDDETATIGSLSSLYHSLANLDCAHFVTKGAKKSLLRPTSSFEDEYKRLKLDITDSPIPKYLCCSNKCYTASRYRCASIYYDVKRCRICDLNAMIEVVAKKRSQAACSDGVLTICKASFTISDDLQIFPNEIGLLQIITLLGITDAHEAEEIQVDLGFNEIMKLLKASLTSPTPLTDVILNKTTEMNSPRSPLHEISIEENPKSRNLSLKVMIHKSTGKFLYAQAKEDFVEFLFSFFSIPVGGVEHLLGGKTCVKAIDNLYWSTTDLIDSKYFKTPNTKQSLMNPNLPHGCISQNHILPLTEECIPFNYTLDLSLFSSDKFPNGQGSYLEGPKTYKVTDDLTVTPFGTVAILSGLNGLKIPVSDVEETEIQIGLKEALSILRASLSSTCVITDALLAHTSNKRIKRQV